MKQLICEMCGSADLVKQEGVFVCQSCGCKYSVEEARKMMIEGKVEVAGTVKVDDTEKIDNYLELSKNAYNSGNGESAFTYANKALEIAPQNSKAWIAKMKAVEKLGTLGDPKLVEVIEAGKNAIAYADDLSKQDIMFEVYSYEATRSLELLKVAMIHMSDTEDIKRTFKQFCMISLLTAPKNTQDVDSKVIYIYENLVNEAVAMIQLIPEEALVEFPEIVSIVKECAKQYQYETNAFVERLKIYGSDLTPEAKSARNTIIKAIEDKAYAAEKIVNERKQKEQAERNAKYWEEHCEEKLSLENEKVDLDKKVTELTQSLDELPEVSAVKQAEQQIEILVKEKDSLGLFKGKEKKILQGKIDNLKEELSKAKTAKYDVSKPIEKEIFSLRKRIREIDDELTKNR